MSTKIATITPKGFYSFENPSIRQTKICDGVWLRLGKTGCKSLARIYFVDEMQREIKIPDKISVIDDTANSVLNPLGETFALCYTDNYSVKYDGELIFSVKILHQWVISGPIGVVMETIKDYDALDQRQSIMSKSEYIKNE
jgi:hypothetical protein